MSGKLVSQFKDEETIENALRGCHENVRLMKSSAVLMEVLGLLKNEEYAKDALSALANFLNNNSQEKKSTSSYVLKILLKMKELIPEEMDVFIQFLEDQETKKNAWICVENLVSDTFGGVEHSLWIVCYRNRQCRFIADSSSRHGIFETRHCGRITDIGDDAHTETRIIVSGCHLPRSNRSLK